MKKRISPLILLSSLVIILSLGGFFLRFHNPQSQSNNSVRGQDLPPNYQPTSSDRILKRIDNPGSAPATPFVARPELTKFFNAVDEKGLQILQGLFISSSGHPIASGLIKSSSVNNNTVLIQLQDSDGSTFPFQIKLSTQSNGLFPTVFLDKPLDFRHPPTLFDTDIVKIISGLNEVKVLFELDSTRENNATLEKIALSSSSQSTSSANILSAKSLYLSK